MRNRFMDQYGADVPHAYPEINNLTRPLRAAAIKQNDDGTTRLSLPVWLMQAESINLWAGQAHELAEALPAEEIVQKLAAAAKSSLDATVARLTTPRK